MKLNISFNKERFIIKVNPTDNVYKIKQKVERAAQLPTPCFAPISTKSQTVLLLNSKENTCIIFFGKAFKNFTSYLRLWYNSNS